MSKVLAPRQLLASFEVPDHVIAVVERAVAAGACWEALILMGALLGIEVGDVTDAATARALRLAGFERQEFFGELSADMPWWWSDDPHYASPAPRLALVPPAG